MQEIKFTKYQGAGNDFILIDNRTDSVVWNEEIITKMCDRRFGIGADGVMLLEKSDSADFYMRYFNSDGSQVGMCGNGARCITLFAHHLGVGEKHKTFVALDGAHCADVVEENGDVALIKVKLIDVNEVKIIDTNNFFMNSGVNHHIEFVESTKDLDIICRGSSIRYSERYENIGGTNANFVKVIDSKLLELRTYERGVENETLACGTGATATAIAAAVKTKDFSSPKVVKAVGGDLKIYFDYSQQDMFTNVYLEGEAKRVYCGVIKL